MRKILLLTIYCSIIGNARAQWVADPTEGTPVVTTAAKGTSSISAYASASDGAGGMFIAWIDSRNSATTGDDIFITRLKADGSVAAGFAANGNVVCNATGTQSNVTMVADGNGGVNLVWQDARDNATLSSDIYGVKVKGDGTVDGPVNGFPISTTSVNENGPSIATVGVDKVAVVWRYTGVSTSTDLAINFADFAAKNKVLANGVTIADKANAQSNAQVVADGSGGALVVWVDPRIATTNANLYGQRISAAGTLLWGPVGSEIDGLQLTNTVGNSLLPQAVSDGAGGMVVAFGSTRVASDNANIYAIRVDGSGNNVWTASGVNVCLAISTQSNVRVVKSGNNYLVAWADRRESTNPPALSNNIDIYIQSLNEGDGSAKWAADGVPVIKQANSQPNSQTEGFEVQDDGAGGAFVIWDDARISTSDLDVFAQHIKPADGGQDWPATGAPVATRAGSNQNWPRSVKSNDGKIMVAWRDSRSTSSNAEIFAALIEPSGLLPVNFLEVSATAQAKQVLVKWTTAQEQKLAFYEVERSVNGIDFTLAGSVKARNSQGVQQYGFTDYTPASGNNYYRIKSLNLDGTSKFSNMVKVNLPFVSDQKVQLFPNPAVASLQLQLNNLPAGNYQLRIINAAGQPVENLRLQKTAGAQVFGLQVGKFSQGLYRLQLLNEKGELISVQSLLKK